MNRPIRLIVLPATPDDPGLYRIVEDGRVAERGLLSEGHAAPHGDFPTILVVPGVDVLTRWLALPPGRDLQAAAAAAFMLEEELAAARERLHVAVGPSHVDGLRPVCVVDRDRMQAWMDVAAGLGLSNYAIVPDHLMLPEPEGEETLAVVLGSVAAVRGPHLALTCDAELLPVVMGQRPYRLAETAEAERAASAGAAQPLVDLRQGAFARRGAGEGGSWTRAAVLAGLVAASLVALPVVQTVRYTLAARSAEARIETLAGPAAPGLPAEPPARLAARVGRLRAAEAFPSTAAALFAAVQGVEGMELQSMLYREDGSLAASIAHVNYSDVEVLKATLGRSNLLVEEKSAAADQGGVRSDITVRPRP